MSCRTLHPSPPSPQLRHDTLPPRLTLPHHHDSCVMTHPHYASAYIPTKHDYFGEGDGTSPPLYRPNGSQNSIIVKTFRSFLSIIFLFVLLFLMDHYFSTQIAFFAEKTDFLFLSKIHSYLSFGFFFSAFFFLSFCVVWPMGQLQCRQRR